MYNFLQSLKEWVELLSFFFYKGNKSKKPGEKVFNSKFSLFTGSPYSSVNTSASSNQSWQEILEREQNAIYCKEIYNQVKNYFCIICDRVENLSM